MQAFKHDRTLKIKSLPIQLITYKRFGLNSFDKQDKN